MAKLVRLALVIAAINVLTSLYVWIPLGSPAHALVLLPETIAIVWLVVVLSGASRSLRRPARVALGTGLGVLIGFAAAETLFEFIYGRPFAPRIDIPMVRGGLLLLLGEIGPIVEILTPITVTLILAALVLAGIGLVRLVERTARSMDRPMAALGTVTLVAVVALATVGAPRSLVGLTIGSWFEDGRIEFTAHDVVTGSAATEYAFPGILDRDIHVFMVEAYGMVAFTRDEINREIAPALGLLEQALTSNGYEVVSSYLQAPVAGGFSWLSEATLLTGQWITTQQSFQQLYGARLPTLTRMLHDGGYYTFTIRPGTVHGEWPEGWEIYGFEESMLAYGRQIGYRGPVFSYVATPDQYSLWRTNERIREVRAPGGPAVDRPLLAYYQLVSSHTPFNRIPPLIDEWSALEGGGIYSERADEILTFNNTWTGGTQMDEGYVASLRYVFTVLSKYIDELLDHERNPIIIILGDHQPQRPIREDDALLSVPVHIASRDREVIKAFQAEGYSDGLIGALAPPHPRMSTFFPTFARIARPRATSLASPATE